MTALLIILAAIALLIIGYITYGSWLAKQWGIDPSRKTPAIEKEDGVDYVAAPPAVLMGHHFSSIAGAGPINGPIQASIFGWVPVFLWCIVGGIFFGGLQDFGSLFASIRHDGKSLGEIINDTMGQKAKKLFLIFGLLVLILVIASFVNVVAGTFFTEEGGFGFTGNPTNNQTTAMISLLFILIAIIYGYVTNKMNIKTVPASICGVIGIIVITVIGLNCGFVMSRTAWIVFIGVYIAVASLVPVWILLQPRDYLSSFLLYAMIGIAVIGLLVFFVLATWLIRRQLKPLRLLTNSAQRIAEGNLNEKISETDREDEIGQLQNRFCKMQQSLQNQIHELEQTTVQLNQRSDVLRTAYGKTEEADRMKTSFLHYMTNQMAVPNESIERSVTTLCNNYRDMSKEEIEQQVDNIQRKSDAIVELLNHMIHFTQPQSGKEVSHD